MKLNYLINNQINNLLAWQNNKFPPPVILNIHLTEKCNLKCLFCERPITKSRKEELTEIKMLDILEEATQIGVKELEINGAGEIFIRKKVTLKIMKKAKEIGLYGNLISNGTLLSEKDIKKIINMKWDKIGISLDGPDSKTHDYLRGVHGAFKKTIQTLKLFRYYQKKSNIDKPEITIATLLTNKNYQKIFELLKLMNYLDLHYIRLELLQDRTQSCHKLKINKEEEEKFILNIPSLEDFASKKKISTNLCIFHNQNILKDSFTMGNLIKKEVKKYKRGLLPLHCHLPWVYIGIREDGFVEPCYQSEFNIESIKRKSLKQIWFGDFFEEIRRSIKEKKMFSFCKTCCGSQILGIKELRTELRKTCMKK